MGEGDDEGEIRAIHLSSCLKKSFRDFKKPRYRMVG